MRKKSIVSMPDQNKQKGKPNPRKLNSEPEYQRELHKKANKKGYNELNTLNTPDPGRRSNEDKNDGRKV